MTKWSACWTHNPVVPGLSSALATCWNCSWSSQVQLQSNNIYYLIGVPVSYMDKLSALSTTDKSLKFSIIYIIISSNFDMNHEIFDFQ